MALLNRRGFLTGLIAAPAVIRVAPLMRVAPVLGWEDIVEEVTFARGDALLTIQQITREAIRMFIDSNSFLQSLAVEPNPLNYTLRIGPRHT